MAGFSGGEITTGINFHMLESRVGEKKEHPLISIILPTYNRCDLLPRAIRSVLAQTYLKWEMIIWDDGSTDSTREVVARFADDRIRYVYDQNHGPAYARNQAIDICKGELVAFLDSDDEWHPEKIEKQAGVLDANPDIEFLFTDFLNAKPGKAAPSRNFQSCRRAMKWLNVQPLGGTLFLIREGFLKSLAIDNYLATDSIMVRLSTLNKVGRFNSAFMNSEDFELWWRMGLANVSMAYLEEITLTRYKLGDNLSHLGATTVKNHLLALNSCMDLTVSAGKNELIGLLDDPFRNAWQNMIYLEEKAGNLTGGLKAFIQSTAYGLRLGSLRLLIQAFFIHLFSRVISKDQSGKQ